MTTARETAGTAVQEAGTVAATARDEAATVAATATEAAGQVAGEAARQVRDLAAETRDQVRSQAETQTRRLAENARSLAGQITSMASNAQEQGPATEVAHQLADKVQSLAGYLEGQTPEALLDDLRTYARRRPGLFLLGAGLAGFAAGRLVKGATSSGTAGSTGPAGGAGGAAAFGGTATGDPVAGMELAAGTPTVTTPAVPAFTEPYPAGTTGTPGYGHG